jgi:uncharacterized protein (UPF0333 family)
MGKGPQLPPAVVVIVIVVAVVLAGAFIWKQSSPSSGVSGVAATSAALAHQNKPMTVTMPANLPGGSNSNIPMPGKTATLPGAGGR